MYPASTFLVANINGVNGCLFFFAEGFFSCVVLYLYRLDVERGLVQWPDRKRWSS